MILWSDAAKQQLKKAFIYLSDKNPTAAKSVVAHIHQVISHLPDNPAMGHQQNDYLYKLVVRKTRYVVYYTFDDSGIIIAGIYHERQRQPH